MIDPKWKILVFDADGLVKTYRLGSIPLSVVKFYFEVHKHDMMLDGEWPVQERHRRFVEEKTGETLDLNRYIYRWVMDHSELSM